MEANIKNNETKQSKKRSLNKNDVQLNILCAIPLLSVIIFNYLPMLGIVIAFKNYRFDKGILGSDWVGFKNFEYFLKSNDFVKITWNTLSLNALFIVTGIISAVVLAMLLFELKSKVATKIFQTTLITPNFLSWVIAGYMAYAILRPEYGILNNIIVAMGGKAVNWYSEPKAWPLILNIASVWKNVGMDSVVYYAALMAIDTSYFEAAEVDGASKLQITWNIVIPCLVPLITILTILKIGSIFRADFGLFYQLTRDVGTLYSTTDVIDTYIFRTMRVIGDMSMSAAAGLLQSIVGFALVLLTNYASKKIDADNGLF